MFGRMATDGVRSRVVIEPGDFVKKNAISGEVSKVTTNPIAYDLWYLKHTQNIISLEDPAMDAVPQSYLDGPLDFLADKLGGVKPKCFIRNLSDMVPQDFQNDPAISAQWKAMREYFIHLMPFETWLFGIGAQMPSTGPPQSNGFNPNNAVGYLAFPVGQIGVMEVMSLLRESVLDDDGLDITDDQKADYTEAGGGLFPPPNVDTGKNKCFGDQFITSGYVVVDGRRRNIELTASPIPGQFYNPGVNSPQLWMRYWIMTDEKFPIPGEFLGILCKPLALPPHIWWFQETTPFLYAGNWFETGNLTGGVVTAVVLEADRTDDGVGNLYTVRVQGREIKINSSDFLTYEVDDRVGILKVGTVLETSTEDSFRWWDQVRLTESDENRTFGNDEYVIVPIDFYA